ncbi:uncharacterized protein LOC122660811 [Telopea speciosissima]|uniref:uncharacterized protein LOC122660811 n=1 Tax=Telopea speciosissima TaxID=54955 RepID=UPI001CC37FBC|nr:uncharacterized protein LOC122660811 [Telopea speciosissima]
MRNMFVLTEAPKGVLSGRRSSLSPLTRFPNPPPFSNPKPSFASRNLRGNLNLAVTNAEGGGDSASASKHTLRTSTTRSSPEETLFVGGETVPLEGVIRFDKPHAFSQLKKWGLVALLAGGDVLALLLFAAIGRFNHGFPVLDIETLRTADPFIGGWFLSAYFLGGYGDDGRGMNGMSKAVIAAAKSWALGIPLGLVIRAATSGHIPRASFALVTVGSTVVLLVGWRVLLFTILPSKSQENEVYKRGNPFELFELLTSLVRRW